ncbi:MAG: HAD family hydrolase [Bacteroidetes bacterium]|nr:HAD family hydrolase [Bacteroidota bacterium]
MNLSPTTFDASWTLFLDRDGVINRKIENDYVKKTDNFHFIDGVTEAIKLFAKKFNRIVIVTNQQGIGKGLFTEAQLASVHQYMLTAIMNNGGRIDRIYFCPALASDNSDFRKPNTGMALQAKRDFPEIDFTKSLMVGDSISDMEFGKKLGMKTVFISAAKTKNSQSNIIDWELKSLAELAALIS